MAGYSFLQTDASEDRKSAVLSRANQLPTIDLKSTGYDGGLIIEPLTGLKDLLGTDVNIILRLSRNHASESMDQTGYNPCNPAITYPVLETQICKPKPSA